ncbi:1,4-dihydroxy-2-naphthoate octaprenyltransferase [Psychromonas sp. CNPT3]|uniref:1,4-dihydroxy-2-naphthoate octaprenyltransferase n=1 Tax=Psychromonas sp. CNPT3 TaxID=314282 RepID=UPI00006E9E84|nr:1,4-dihydroxy-2-naphthoate octaprenyltransferase [Psychromonas sp. CNPT3]AGH82203.1 1,4-dihydroxy-2-naphthoate octaprenyltransferase [Psychromonas sp. CNPT3]
MNKFSVWISVLRLRTLPLASSSIIISGAIALQLHIFNIFIFILSLSTALLLQILSNLANDYGDAKTGADTELRLGPQRAMQKGDISQKSMEKAIISTLGFTLISGFSLLLLALGDDVFSWMLFLGLGVLAIVASITYTMGRYPYGYRAMGDISVFLFFGLLGVLGGFYLYDLSFNSMAIYPACSIGLFSAAVLNINNLRDFEADKRANKITLVVLLGRDLAFKYHLCLICMAPLLSIGYILSLEEAHLWQYIFLLVISPLIKTAIALHRTLQDIPKNGLIFNEQLKNTALTTFVFSLLFALAVIPQ